MLTTVDGIIKSPQGTLRKPRIFRDCCGIFGIFGRILRFLVKITCFLSFSGKNDAESSISFIKNLVLDPKRAKLVQKSDGNLTELPRPAQEDP